MSNQPTFEQKLAEFRPRRLHNISLDDRSTISSKKSKSRPELSSVFRYGAVALTSFVLGLATMYFASPYFVLSPNDESRQRSRKTPISRPILPMLDEQTIASLRRPADLLRIQPQPAATPLSHPDDALFDWEERQRIPFHTKTIDAWNL